MRQVLRNNRLSNVMEDDSPGYSEVTDNSTFSALASGKKTIVVSEAPREHERRRTLGERSLAALTSGMADTGSRSR